MKAKGFITMGRIPLLIYCVVFINQIGSLDLVARNSSDPRNASELYREAFKNLKNLSPAEKKLLDSVNVKESDASIDSNLADYKNLLLRLKPSLELVQKASKQFCRCFRG